jgi:hypothetical protein
VILMASVANTPINVLDRHVMHFEPTTRRQRQAMIMSRLHGEISFSWPTHRVTATLYVTVLIHHVLTSTRPSAHLPENKSIQKFNLVVECDKPTTRDNTV